MTTWAYILDLFRPDDQVVICWKANTAAGFNQRFLPARDAAQERFQRFLRAMNAQGNNIYIGMNPIRPNARTRTKRDIAEVRRIYLDLDQDGDTALQQILTSPVLPQPNYMLDTSPAKHQVIWNVSGFEPHAAEDLMRSLSRQFQTDPATVDVARVFRLPGLHNKKYADTFRVTVRKLTSAVRSPQDFPAFEPTSTPLPRQRRFTSIQRNSQSERDWGYCCQALWPDPHDQAVVDRLLKEMERRAQGRRAKPRYYAELTVRNAQEYMAAKKRDSSGGA